MQSSSWASILTAERDVVNSSKVLNKQSLTALKKLATGLIAHMAVEGQRVDKLKGKSLVLEDIPSPKDQPPPTSLQIAQGRIIPPQQQLLLLSADAWEEFTNEWAFYQRKKYLKVARLSGAGDMGIDVAGFTDEKHLQGIWDNYQCKHYDCALTPSVSFVEIGKMLWYSFGRNFAPPRKYYFVSPKDCGLSLKKLLMDEASLKTEVKSRWNKWCAAKITNTQTIELIGDFADYFEEFDFSIFAYKSALELIEEHRQTPYFAARFGGGLPTRPRPEKPPESPTKSESRYIQQLYEAYGDYKKTAITEQKSLESWPELSEHFLRQREHFYHAESLRNFARDNVPPGTFEELQDEIHTGVVDVHTTEHSDGFKRLSAVMQTADTLSLTANGLISVTKPQDRHGICHQLANDNRLQWVKP